MINPKRDSLIALIVTLVALAAVVWGLQRVAVLGQDDAPGGIAIGVGGLVAFFGVLAWFNFLWSLRIARRMQRGTGIFARWTVPADTVTAYLAQEAARPSHSRSRWRPKPGRAAEILFSDDAILAGGHYHGLKSRGLQVFTAITLLPGTPDVLEFRIQEITTSSANNYAAGKFELRLPVPASAADPAGKVLDHFRTALTGDGQDTSGFWRLRKRIGTGILLASIAAGAAGYILAEGTSWQGDGGTVNLAIVLMITGLMFGLAGLFLTVISSVALRRAQRRQGIRPAR